jgi:cephalosporin hydroxylase
MLERYMQRARGRTPRFAAWKERRHALRAVRDSAIPGTELDTQAFLYSQGAGALSFQWRGRSCLKSVYDIGIYLMLLSELQPRTIVELGAGTGGSALLFADVSKALGIDAIVHVVDREPATFEFNRPDIHYHQSDCSEWMRMRAADPAGVDHPCVIIEDYHAADAETLIEAERILRPGDYLVIEDSLVKQDLIRQVLSRDSFQIDTQLTDFFGINCTSAVNGILRRV